MPLALDVVEQLAHRHHPLQQPDELRAFDLLSRGQAHFAVLHRALHQERVQRGLVLQVTVGLPGLGVVERGLGDVEVPALDELLHLPIEEGEEQGADVRAVDVGVAHQDDAVVAELADVEVVGPHAGSEGRDDVADLLAGQGLVEPRLLHVQDLAAQGQNGLEGAVAPLLGRAAGRIALHQVQLALPGVALLTLRELAGEAGAVEGAFPPREIAGLARCFARARRLQDLLHDALGDGGVLLQER